MIICRHYWIGNRQFRCGSDPFIRDLIQKLEAFGLKVTTLERCFAFDITEDNPCFNDVLDIINAAETIEGTSVSIEFSKKYCIEELNKAEYLHIRSTYAGVIPLEEYRSSYVSFIHNSNQQGHLHEHFIQVGPPVIKKHPSWRPDRHFATDYDSAAIHLFCSNTAKQIIQDNQLKGADFRPVLDVQTMQPSEHVFQLFPLECVDFLLPGRFLSPGWNCCVCNQRRYINQDGRAELFLRRSLLPEKIDFMQTPPLVGGDTGHPYYVISNRAYHVLRDNRLTRGLVFEALSTLP